MRAVKAKALRKALGFHPHAERTYKVDKTLYGAALSLFTGHVTSTGARARYQNVKRTPGMVNAILGAHHA